MTLPLVTGEVSALPQWWMLFGQFVHDGMTEGHG